MRKLSEINESLFGKAITRSKSGELRKEDGKKIQTQIGEIVLHNSSIDYKSMMEEILSTNDNIMSIGVYNINDSAFSHEEKYNIIDNKCSYDYLVSDVRSGICIGFTPYNDVIDFELDNDFETNVSEDDYISICKCIANKIKNDCDIEYSSSRNGGCNDYVFKLISENNVLDFIYDNEDEYGDNIYDVFVEDFINNFSDFEEDDIITWTYQDGFNIGIKINYDNLVMYNDIKKFVVDWFKT